MSDLCAAILERNMHYILSVRIPYTEHSTKLALLVYTVELQI